MKTLGWITTAALAIGFGIGTPAMAREEHGRDNRTVEVRQDDLRHDDTRRDVVIHDRPIIVNHDRFVRDPVFVDRPLIEVAPVPIVIGSDCTTAVAIPNLPLCVTDTITLQGRGPIDSVQFVQSNGLQFYDIVCGRGALHFDMHVDPAGDLLTLTAV